MPSVSAAYAHALTTAAGLKLMPDGAVLSGDRVVYRIHHAPTGRVEGESFFDFIAWICENQPDRLSLVQAYAALISVDRLGVLGLALKSAPTFGASLERLQRYSSLLSDTAAYCLEASHDLAVLVLEPRTADHPAMALRNECALAGFVRNARCFGKTDIQFAYVSFRHACKGDPKRYAAYFGCPVLFEAPRDAVAMPHETLDLPNRIGDAAVSEFLTAHLDAELETLSDGRSVRDDVRRRLSTALSGGAPQAADLAREMGMSERTFFRRLSDEGTTFRDVVREAQVALAQELLVHSDCSLAEIAFLTGFAEQSTFGRAFKRWVGEAPAAYRAGRSSLLPVMKTALLAGPAQEVAGRADTGPRPMA